MSDLDMADFVFGAVLFVVVAGFVVLAARRGAGARRLIGLGLFGGYLVVLAMIILCPLPGAVPAPAFPGASVPPTLEVNTDLELRGLLTSGLADQNLQNLLLGVPVGLGLPLVFLRWRTGWLVVAAALLGPLLEGAQAVASLIAGWAYRSVDINDLIPNSLGALLGLLLFAALNSWLSLRAGLARRAVLIGSPVALSLVAVALLAGPRPGLDPAIRYCEVVPAAVADVEGYSVFADHDAVCLAHPQGYAILTPGDLTAYVDSPEDGLVNVVGLAPSDALRVQATLTDGRSGEADTLTVPGVEGWRLYVVPMGSEPTSDFTAEVKTLTR